MGDGSSILICNSHWLPTPWDFKVISPKQLPLHTHVTALLQEDGRWNAQLVSEVFLDFEARAILALSWPSRRYFMVGCPDRYCWHVDKKGEYFVKSAYMMGISRLLVDVPSSSNMDITKW